MIFALPVSRLNCSSFQLCKSNFSFCLFVIETPFDNSFDELQVVEAGNDAQEVDENDFEDVTVDADNNNNGTDEVLLVE